MNLNSVHPQPGDWVIVPKLPFVNHVGVYLGFNQVFQNSPGKGEHVVPYSIFGKGQSVKVKKTNVSPTLLQARVWERLRKPRAYDLISNNCEHTASALTEGEARSPQLATWVILGLIALFVFSRK